MPRFAVLTVLASLVAAPAAAQVINGETPLDETAVSRETPAAQPHPAAAEPPTATSSEMPARTGEPSSADSRHE